jgi:hypothetical protein
VVVFPVQRTYWTPHSRHLKYAQARGDGSFEITGLPPGEYWVAAVDVLETGPGGDEWQHPAVLDALAPRAERLTLAESEAHSMTVRLMGR